MEVRSLGLRTDLMVLRLQGSEVEDRGDHVAVRSPLNPTYWWGNCVYVPGPAGPGDAARWLAAFAAAHPGAAHLAIGVDAPDGDTGDITDVLAAGAELDVDVVLTSASPPAPRRVAAEIRPVTTDADWAEAAAVQAANSSSPPAAAAPMVAARMAGYRRAAGAGACAWFGAHVDGRMVAGLGVVCEDGLARYQHVDTLPAFRRRGLASALLHAAGRHAVERMGARTLVIAAEDDGDGLRLYRALGFTPAERSPHLTRRP